MDDLKTEGRKQVFGSYESMRDEADASDTD